MTNAEIKHLAEIDRLKEAMGKTTSQYLIKDYQKAIKRKELELYEYRNFMRMSR